MISGGAVQPLKDLNIPGKQPGKPRPRRRGALSAVIFVPPSLLMLGLWAAFRFGKTALVCTAAWHAGVLLYTVPLRRVMNAVQPAYPEGVAAARCCRPGPA